jgi:hypothetical protein
MTPLGHSAPGVTLRRSRSTSANSARLAPQRPRTVRRVGDPSAIQWTDATCVVDREGRRVLHRPEPSGGLLPPNTGIRRSAGRNGTGRNKRNVWTIHTQPYPAAHFATFPEALVLPMVLAGSAPGSLVLDPFAGSGTTLKVAVERGRDAIGVELNPAYIGLIERRLAGVTPPLFAEGCAA